MCARARGSCTGPGEGCVRGTLRSALPCTHSAPRCTQVASAIYLKLPPSRVCVRTCAALRDAADSAHAGRAAAGAADAGAASTAGDDVAAAVPVEPTRGEDNASATRPACVDATTPHPSDRRAWPRWRSAQSDQESVARRARVLQRAGRATRQERRWHAPARLPVVPIGGGRGWQLRHAQHGDQQRHHSRQRGAAHGAWRRRGGRRRSERARCGQQPCFGCSRRPLGCWAKRASALGLLTTRRALRCATGAAGRLLVRPGSLRQRVQMVRLTRRRQTSSYACQEADRCGDAHTRCPIFSVRRSLRVWRSKLALWQQAACDACALRR
jgi:hypothetical protein